MQHVKLQFKLLDTTKMLPKSSTKDKKIFIEISTSSLSPFSERTENELKIWNRLIADFQKPIGQCTEIRCGQNERERGKQAKYTVTIGSTFLLVTK